MDQKEYFKRVKEIATQLHESAKDMLEYGSNNATTHYDLHINEKTDLDDEIIYNDDFEILLSYAIMQFDDVIQVEVNAIGDHDVNIVFKDEILNIGDKVKIIQKNAPYGSEGKTGVIVDYDDEDVSDDDKFECWYLVQFDTPNPDTEYESWFTDLDIEKIE